MNYKLETLIYNYMRGYNRMCSRCQSVFWTRKDRRIHRQTCGKLMCT